MTENERLLLDALEHAKASQAKNYMYYLRSERPYSDDQNKPDEYIIYGYKPVAETIVLPAVIGKRRVTAIGASPHSQTIGFEKPETEIVIVSEGIEEILDDAFYYLRNLKSIYIPDSIKDIAFGSLHSEGDYTIFCHSGNLIAIEAAKQHRVACTLLEDILPGEEADKDSAYYSKAFFVFNVPINHIPEEHRTIEMCNTAIEESGTNLEYVPMKLRTKELCKAAVQQYPWMFEKVPDAVKDYDFCRWAVSIADNLGRENFKYVPDQFKTPELCMIAVKKDGRMLEHIPSSLITEEMCIAAITTTHAAVQLVPDSLLTEDMCILALGKWPKEFLYLPERMLTPRVCEAARMGLPYCNDQLRARICEILDRVENDHAQNKE